MITIVNDYGWHIDIEETEKLAQVIVIMLANKDRKLETMET